eukprot:gene14957-35105_t
MLLFQTVLLLAASTSSPTTFVIDEPTDLILSGGASLTSAPLYSLRSGNPPAKTSASIRTVLNPGATIASLSFAYRYDTGFGPTGVGANFTLRAAGQAVYESPHFTDYSYGQNKSNYSQPIQVTASKLAIVVPSGPQAKDSHLEFDFQNNARNVQLLLPLTITIECSGDVPCTPPMPHQSHSLVFEDAPRIVAGPERPQGWAESHVIASTDAGATWTTPDFQDNVTCPMCDAKTSDAFYPKPTDGGAGCGGNDCGQFRTIGELNETTGTKSNLTGLAGVASTRYFLDSDGNFARELAGGTSITGLPNLRMFGFSG